MKKSHPQNLRTWKIPFPIFKNWNERLSFPGIASNGNSRSSVTFLWLNCKHGSKKCISALQPSSNVPIAFKNGGMCPRRDTALGHHAKRERPRRASTDLCKKNEFATLTQVPSCDYAIKQWADWHRTCLLSSSIRFRGTVMLYQSFNKNSYLLSKHHVNKR